MSLAGRAVLGLAALAALGARSETLGDAWQDALAQDLSLSAAATRVAAAEADVGGARAARRPILAGSASVLELDRAPSFDFSGAGMPLQLPLLDGSRLVMAGATVTVPIYTAGETRAAIDAARASLDAERHAEQSLAQQIKLAVAERYVGVLRAGSALAVAQSNVASLAGHLREVEDMYRGGSVPRNDFLAASVSLADAEQRRLQARHGLDSATAAYNRALGRALDAPTDLDVRLPGVDPRVESGSIAELTAFAVTERAEPRRLDSTAAALAAQAESARAATRPQVALTGGFTRIENEFLNREDFWTLGVGVSFQPFDGGRTRSRVSALSLRSTAITRQRQDVESLIALEVRQAWLMREETVQRIAVTERAVEQAEENLRVARDRYRNGEGTNTEVLDAEALRNVSLDNHDAARYDAALARFRLAYAVGLL